MKVFQGSVKHRSRQRQEISRIRLTSGGGVQEKFPAIGRVAVEEKGSRVILDSWRSCWSGFPRPGWSVVAQPRWRRGAARRSVLLRAEARRAAAAGFGGGCGARMGEGGSQGPNIGGVQRSRPWLGRGSPAGIAEAVAGRDLGGDDGSDKWGRLVRGKGVTRALACGSGWQVGLSSERAGRTRGAGVGAGRWGQ